MQIETYDEDRKRKDGNRISVPISLPIMMSDIAFLMGVDYAPEPEGLSINDHKHSAIKPGQP